MEAAMPLTRLASLLALLTLSLLPASSPVQAQPEWIAPLRGGGHVIVIRHGATYPDQADTDPLNLDNIEKQRQLNDAGRGKAKEIGEAMRKLKIPVGEVHTSKIYRAIETGKLMFPELTPMPTVDLVETGQVSTPIENNRRIAAIRKLAATVPPAGTNVVAVTHKPNVLDAFGKDWFDLAEGEASIFKPDGNAYAFVVRVKADEWAKLAQ
jgi:phosphohistidine phosphatase SixA